MPLYSYLCLKCGSFDQMHAMADSQTPANCPQCGQLCPRQITASRLNLMSGTSRTVHSLNEKNAHEPRIGQRGGDSHEHAASGHVHGPGCGHGQQGAHLHAAASRPWQVGH